MPIDGQSTRQRPFDPKSPPDATKTGANGESGIPPTEKRKPAMPTPSTKPKSLTTPTSFPSMAEVTDPLRTRSEALEDPEILTNRSGSQDFVNKQRRETISLSTADTARRTLNSLYTTDVFAYTDASLIEWFRKRSNRCSVLFYSFPGCAHDEGQARLQE